VAAGLAYSHKLRGRKSIAVAFIGDGTLGEGVIYETFNISSKWELPLLIVQEHNRYSQSTPHTQTLAGDIEGRAAAFGISTARAEVWSLERLLQAAENAVTCVRDTSKPYFLRVDCDRLMAHSKGDDNRDAAELARCRERDPLRVFSSEQPKEAVRLQAEAKSIVDEAIARCESAPAASDASMEDADPLLNQTCSFQTTPKGPEERVADLLFGAFRRNLQRDPRILLIGEDIEAPYGGAFKVTKTLSQEFPGRVRNTPNSEAAICGLGNGLALAGFIPVVEFMFGDFIMLAADQLLNSAAKFRYMYNNQVQVPIVLRTPMGGRRGYGPTHSQSLEKHLLGIPGTLVIALNSSHDPGAVYDTLFRIIDRPTLVIENKLLYGSIVNNHPPQGFIRELSDERFPTSRLRPEGSSDLTILCYGGMSSIAEAAAEVLLVEEEIACEVICPEQLYPFNLGPLLESVRRTRRLLVVEEGQGFAGFGSEAIARLMEAESAPPSVIRRLAAARHPIPSAGPLEAQALPGKQAILRIAKEMYLDR